MEESLLTDLARGVTEYRRKDMFDARSFTAIRVEIRRGDEILVFEKSGDEETWQNASGQNVDTSLVEDLLTKLSNLRALSFEASTSRIARDAGCHRDHSVSTATGRKPLRLAVRPLMCSPAAQTSQAQPGVDAMLFDEAVKAVDALK